MNKSTNRSPVIVLAIDPGRSKTGLAIVKSSGEIEEKRIISTGAFQDEFLRLINSFNPDVIAIGDGTACEEIRQIVLDSLEYEIPISLVDEKGTTEEARHQYFSKFPVIKRFFYTLLYITGALNLELDHDVAVILANRYLLKKRYRTNKNPENP